MSRISATFERLRSEGMGGYIPYICAGDPDEEFTVALAKSLCEAGADLIELGIPFSDPVADGPVIQQAMARSLSGGFRVARVFDIIGKLRGAGIDQPIVVMTYYNPVLRLGPGEFCRKLARAGADGLLVVDVPLEESSEVDAAASSSGLDVIRLVSPSTSEERIGRILSSASGFVYVVSVAGTTGARHSLPSSANELLRRVSEQSRLPVALGFGISEVGHVRDAMESGAAGVVEGSKLASLYSEHLEDRRQSLAAVGRHVREMKAAAKRKRS